MTCRPAPILAFLLLAALPAPSIAQPAPPPPMGPPMMGPPPMAALDADARRDVVAKLGAALRDRYVVPEIGEQAAAKIAASLAAGDYDQLTSPVAFAARLSADIAGIAHDKHLSVVSMMGPPPPPPATFAEGGPPPAEAGVVRADKLPGGIGYIEIIGFAPIPAFKPALDRAMSSLFGSRALIIDARRNMGGAPEGVAYLSSFLVAPDKPVDLNVIVGRKPGTKEFTRTVFRSQPTPVNFGGVPVSILISRNTFSGGEGFAYEMQALKRATVIGEVTGGGANPTGPVPLGRGFMVLIPGARAENPVTKTNWEGRGVQPDVAVPAAEAFGVALQRLGQKPARDIAAASATRVFAPRSAALPGSEATLRRLIDGYASGQLDESLFAPQSLAMARQTLPQLRGALGALGALRSVRFLQPFVMGGDEFELAFEKGTVAIALLTDPSGKVLALSDPRPVCPGGPSGPSCMPSAGR